jgi:hypothetical protein
MTLNIKKSSLFDLGGGALFVGKTSYSLPDS